LKEREEVEWVGDVVEGKIEERKNVLMNVQVFILFSLFYL
jgi:hypothetical protein